MHIIVCEDDQLVRKIVSSVLELGGHRVENACDGQEAFEKIQANPGAFDLLVADNLMPRLSGLELVEKLRGLHFTLKTVMVTGFATNLDVAEQERLQISGSIKKPFKPKELLECVNSLFC